MRWLLLALALSGCGEEHTGIVRRAVPRVSVGGGGCKTCMTYTYNWCRVYLTDGWHCDDDADDCEGIDVGQTYTFKSCEAGN